MCLTKTHKFPKISWKPIKVYKVVTRRGKQYNTPIRMEKVKIGETIKAKDFWLTGISKKWIEGEGVHAFMTFDKAKESGLYRILCKRRIIEAEIPPFTPYWIGMHGDIAASKMKLIRVI